MNTVRQFLTMPVQLRKLHKKWAKHPQMWRSGPTKLPPPKKRGEGDPLWWLCSCLIAGQKVQELPRSLYHGPTTPTSDMFFKHKEKAKTEELIQVGLTGWGTGGWIELRFDHLIFRSNFDKESVAVTECATWIYDTIFSKGYAFMMPKEFVVKPPNIWDLDKDVVKHAPDAYFLIGRPAPLCIACASPATGTCAQCKQAVYCGKTCQVEHWKTHVSKCAY